MILSAIRTGHQRARGEDLFFPASETPRSRAGKHAGAALTDRPVWKGARDAQEDPADGDRRRHRDLEELESFRRGLSVDEPGEVREEIQWLHFDPVLPVTAGQVAVSRLVTTKRGLGPFARCSALPTTRRVRDQMFRVRYRSSLNTREPWAVRANSRRASHQDRKSSRQKPESARTMILVSGHDSRILLTRKASVGVDPDAASMSAFLRVAARRCSPANTYKGRKQYLS